ncbi:MAG: hypothetical protein AAGE52_40730 [Myxococcota bacterium]
MSLLDPVRGLTLTRSAPGDRYFDYCLQPYTPRRPPNGKLRSENLLWACLEMAGMAKALRAPLTALQEALGRDMIVWGVKHDETRLWCELYVYDPQKEDPRATVAGLTEILAPWFELRPSPRETIPYMMASFDLDPQTIERGVIDEINLYLTGSNEHAGRSYLVREHELEMANIYRFLEPKQHVDEVLSLIRSSATIDYTEPQTLSAVLIPELFACKRVCVAKKRVFDGVYYSGIDVDQLLFFLKRCRYPQRLQELVHGWASDLDHLYFDVGLDVEQHEGAIRYPKTSFYGTL